MQGELEAAPTASDVRPRPGLEPEPPEPPGMAAVIDPVDGGQNLVANDPRMFSYHRGGR